MWGAWPTYLGTYVSRWHVSTYLPWYWSGVGTQAGKSLVILLNPVRYLQSTRAGFQRLGSSLWTTSVPRFCRLSIYAQYYILLHPSTCRQPPVPHQRRAACTSMSPRMYCQKCRTPLKLDSSLEDLNPAAYDLLVGKGAYPPITITTRRS